jgi:hypothetical protein
MYPTGYLFKRKTYTYSTLRLGSSKLNTGIIPYHILLSNRLSVTNKLSALNPTHTPIHCYDLSPALMGSGLDQELADRRRWCRENCPGFDVTPQRTHPEGHPYYVFWFEKVTDAILFRLHCSPVTTPPDEVL